MCSPASPLRRGAKGVDLALKVTPGAARNAVGPVMVEGDGAATLKVSVTAVPENGRANKAVEALLAKTWRLPRGQIAVVSGATSRRKTVRISGEPDRVVAAIQTWLEKTGARSETD